MIENGFLKGENETMTYKNQGDYIVEAEIKSVKVLKFLEEEVK